MKMIDVSKVRVFRVCLFVLFMLFMRIGWASNDDSTYNIVDFGAKGDGITDNTQFINRTIEDCSFERGRNGYHSGGNVFDRKYSAEK